VDKDELRAVFPHMRNEQVEALMRAADENSDGCMSFEELCALIQAHESGAGARPGSPGPSLQRAAEPSHVQQTRTQATDVEERGGREGGETASKVPRKKTMKKLLQEIAERELRKVVSSLENMFLSLWNVFSLL